MSTEEGLPGVPSGARCSQGALMNYKRFLCPGDLYFGGDKVWVETVLGPCVSITLWFPKERQGGMCHFLLPGRHPSLGVQRDLDGRYACGAWAWLKRQVASHALRLQDAEIKLFGGASSLAHQMSWGGHIGQRNIACAERLMDEAQVHVVGRDLGGEGCRYVRFNLSSGDVWVRRARKGFCDSPAG